MFSVYCLIKYQKGTSKISSHFSFSDKSAVSNLEKCLTVLCHVQYIYADLKWYMVFNVGAKTTASMIVLDIFWWHFAVGCHRPKVMKHCSTYYICMTVSNV